MISTPLISLAYALILFASRTDAQASSTSSSPTNGLGHKTGVTESQSPQATKKDVACPGSDCPNNSTTLGTASTKHAQNAGNSNNGTAGPAGTTSVTGTQSSKGSSATVNTAPISKERSQTDTTASAPTTKGSTAPAQRRETTPTGVMDVSVTAATSGGYGNTTGTSNSSAPATSAAGSPRLSRAAYLDVLVAALGALLWWSSL